MPNRNCNQKRAETSCDKYENKKRKCMHNITLRVRVDFVAILNAVKDRIKPQRTAAMLSSVV